MQRIHYVVSGKVLRGAGYGRALGFPTANLDRREYARKKLRIPFGVYAGTTQIEGMPKTYRAGIVIGPQDKGGLPKIEVHLLDFSGDLYGEKMRLTLTHFLRPFKTFVSTDRLVTQIERDVRNVRALIT